MTPFEQAWSLLKQEQSLYERTVNFLRPIPEWVKIANKRAELRDATVAARQQGRQVPEAGLFRLDGSPRIGGQQNRLMNYPGQTFQPRPSDTYRSRVPETGPVQSEAIDPEAVHAMGSRIQTPEQMDAQREGMKDDYPYEFEGFSRPPKVKFEDLVNMHPIYNDVNDKLTQGYIDQALQERGFENFTNKELQGVEEQGSPEQKRALQEYLANRPPQDPYLGVLYG